MPKPPETLEKNQFFGKVAKILSVWEKMQNFQSFCNKLQIFGKNFWKETAHFFIIFSQNNEIQFNQKAVYILL